MEANEREKEVVVTFEGSFFVARLMNAEGVGQGTIEAAGTTPASAIGLLVCKHSALVNIRITDRTRLPYKICE